MEWRDADSLVSLTHGPSSFVRWRTRFSECAYAKDSPSAWPFIEYNIRSTGKDELLETAMALHDAAMKDEYFIKRKLAPNVDFWYVASVFSPATALINVRGIVLQEVCIAICRHFLAWLDFADCGMLAHGKRSAV